jgi:predicted Zn-dependent protease
MLEQLSVRGRLDDDAALLERARRISAGLVAAAKQMRPEAAGWTWEVHVTSDAGVSAFCIAGGKILVGRGIVRALDLADGELAMLLAHEIAHAVAGHRREAARGGVGADPAEEVRQVSIAVAQENEADEIGMRLAIDAGWRSRELVAFYDKLAAREGAGTYNSSHGTAATRAQAARDLAARLDAAAPRK